MIRHGIGKGRIEAFSDGVIAIIITIMVLDLKAPAGSSFADLVTVIPGLLTYILSFVYVGIYWNNHHHLFQAADGATGPIMLANLHLLFWLSLIPFVTGWMGTTPDDVAPVASYGVILLMNACAYRLLAAMLARHEGAGSQLAQAIGDDRKGKLSIALYAVGVTASFFLTELGLAVYVAVALIWLVPDRRVERVLASNDAAAGPDQQTED
ncbi:TMEM175 family protein [Croceicoccus sp. F390]|uniref:TMEM175 family protein n=1 Tax=Croceicoccus esteveae TaxID=3075597 RepID=A0ABU2ZKJ0_9SPHN|nr:TMEM175 family protein [Croceicoccus sp. F390]MDT0577120.1 TMEM175 family protein [Croceicoccus sp. F390]